MDALYYEKYRSALGQWHMRRLIGQGSNSCVYEIERQEMGVTYKAALKIVSIITNEENTHNEEDINYYESILQRYLDECALMTKLKGNTNIISYEDCQVFQRDNNNGWDILIRMELLTPVLEYFELTRLDDRQVIQIALDVCEALILCENNGIVHKDINLKNIFVSSIGRCKVGDFSSYRVLHADKNDFFDDDMLEYVAPEVIEKFENYDNRVHIYALGIVMYNLLNARRQFPFLSQQLMNDIRQKENVQKHLNTWKNLMSGFANNRLIEIILKACAYNPDNRYKNANLLKLELEQCLGCVNREHQETFKVECSDTEILDVGDANFGHMYWSNGYSIGQYAEHNSTELSYDNSSNDNYEFNNNKKSGNKKIIIVLSAFVIFLGIVFALCIVFGLNVAKKYEQANQLYEQGEYHEAIEIFESIKFYKDAEDRIADAQNRAEYEKACKLLEQEQYDEAIEIFEVLGNYEDSEEKVITALNLKKMMADYNKASVLFNEGDYFGALQLFSAIEDYKDCSEKKEMCKANIKIGNEIRFGNIKWIVVQQDADILLLTSVAPVGYKPYNDENINVSWEECSLRKWLNSDFINTTFNDVDKSKLSEVAIGKDAKDANITDKVFLLPKATITNSQSYFAGDSEKLKLYINAEDTAWWWLCDNGIDECSAMYVNKKGKIVPSGANVAGSDIDHTQYLDGAVRPAIILNFNNL